MCPVLYHNHIKKEGQVMRYICMASKKGAGHLRRNVARHTGLLAVNCHNTEINLLYWLSMGNALVNSIN